MNSKALEKVAGFFSPLLSDKIPYWLTLFFAVWAWTITTLVASVSRGPLVEFRLSTLDVPPTSGFNRRADIHLENLSKVEGFSKFVVVVRRKDNSQTVEFADDDVAGSVSVALNSGKLFEDLDVTRSPDAIQIRVAPFPPGAKLDLAILFKGQGTPGVVASSEDGKRVNVTEPTPATYFARNESWVLFGGAIVFSIALLASVLIGKRGVVQSKTDIAV